MESRAAVVLLLVQKCLLPLPHTRLFHLLPRDHRSSHADGQTQGQAKPLVLWSHATAGFGPCHGSHCTSQSQILPSHGHFYINAVDDGEGTIPGFLHPSWPRKETNQADWASSEHGPTQLRELYIPLLPGLLQVLCIWCWPGKRHVLPAQRCQTTLSTASLLPVNLNPAGNI